MQVRAPQATDLATPPWLLPDAPLTRSPHIPAILVMIPVSPRPGPR